jgi:hypothetical protein
MRIVAIGLGLLLGALVLSVGVTVPASAEFFGCHDRPGQLLYSYKGTPSEFHDRNSSNSRFANSYAAQPRRYSRSRVIYYGSRNY